MQKTKVADPKVRCGTCRFFDGTTWCRHWNFFTTADSPPCRFYRRAASPPPAEPASPARSVGVMKAAKRDRLSDEKFAFPKQRKEPLNDASHVRNAIARFDQVEDVSDEERAAAWRRIKAAAKKHGVDVEVSSWRELMK